MKYGRLVFSREFVSPTVCNIGDIAQTLAIDVLYEKMGIEKTSIVDVYMEEVGTYTGETVRLPLNGYFQYSKEYPAFPTSKCIEPVFLGAYTTSPLYLRHKKFWKNCGPIGCRDEATYHEMKKHGYDAYLNGCMTMLFPKRQNTPSKPHVFVVDAYPTVLDYIPEELKPSLEFVAHDIPVDPRGDKKEIAKQCEAEARKLYDRYRDEATLVITSRLHCAAPCIAMGIPTIVVKNGFDERFGWLDKFVPLYTEDEFQKINWQPEPVDLEEFKEILFRNAAAMLQKTADPEKIQHIHAFYMNRQRKSLKAPLLVRSYVLLAQYFPGLASFLREKVLFRFTIAAKSEKIKEKGTDK